MRRSTGFSGLPTCPAWRAFRGTGTLWRGLSADPPAARLPQSECHARARSSRPQVRPSLELLDRLVEEVETVFHGKREVVRLAVAALLARGHILFEDVPGVGKTTLAHALARTLGLTFRRIQFTSDLLPSDVLGVSVFNPADGDVRDPARPDLRQRGAGRRDQPRAAAHAERSAPGDAGGAGHHRRPTFELPHPFLVIATQNPLEHHGTYPLPESQLDRFLMRLTIGYPDESAERRILLESASSEPVLDRLQPMLTPAEVIYLQNEVESVRADPSLIDYLMEIVRRTRSSNAFRLGVSPRGSIGLFRAARAHALTDGRTFLVPDDVRSVVIPCLAHRLLPAGLTSATLEAHAQSAALLEKILDDVQVPA